MSLKLPQNVKISITLDKRRKLDNGKYPIKLRVYHTVSKTQKLYNTPYQFSETEFESIWLTVKTRNEYKKSRLLLQELELAAEEVISGLKPFSFEKFERNFLKGYKEELPLKSINDFYKQKIQYHKDREGISTATNYTLALRSLQKFAKADVLYFEDITPKFLEEYERNIIRDERKTITTVGMYLRTLRTVFNDAKIPKDAYPFGRGKYIIKSPKKVKKALDSTTLKKLFEGIPQNKEQERAKAFWFFSYLCNGMNIKDILHLRLKDVVGDKITFLRAKTSSHSNQAEPIIVFLTDYSKSVIETYGTKNEKPESYVFPFINDSMGAEDKHRIKQNFTRSINQNFLKYAKSLGITENVSTYYARHSFSTHLIRKGVSIEAVGEALGHTNIKTTMHYFAGFEDESKKEAAKKLLDFD